MQDAQLKANTRIATVYGYDRIVPKETGDKVRAGVNHPRWNLTHGASKTGTTCIVSLTLLVKGNPAIHPALVLSKFCRASGVKREHDKLGTWPHSRIEHGVYETLLDGSSPSGAANQVGLRMECPFDSGLVSW